MVRFIYYCKLLYIMVRKESGVWLKLAGNGSDYPDSMFDVEQLAIGIKIEMEHTNNVRAAKMIAKVHLSESPLYYVYLVAMEQELEHRKKVSEVYGW